MEKKQGKVASDKSAIVEALPRACCDETAAVEFFEAQRWAETGPCCPHCGGVDVYKMRDRKTGERSKRFLWRCRDCAKQYTVRINSVYEDSAIPMRHWAYGFWKACSSKKGVSALQIKRETGLSYKSALFMMHRIRFAMTPNRMNARPLHGIIEADEAFIGGRDKNRHWRDRSHRQGNRHAPVPVLALLERGGDVRTWHIANVTAQNVGSIIRANVNPENSTLMTDEALHYPTIGKEFGGGHFAVNHAREEYARGSISSNGAESVFALLKRGIYGTFHSVSRKHLHRYLAEFDFRFNARKIDDGARVALAIQGANCRRLRYTDQVGRHALRA